MIEIRHANERGHANYGWLDTYHTFSFADYYDPDYMGFRKLRVINEDHVQPGKGFGTHGHNDMEIITYVLEGSLDHKDSMGNGSSIKPGEVQRMSAGTGVTHSEYNHSPKEIVHLLQIWILPEKIGLKPSYEQRAFKTEQRKNQLCLVVSGQPSGDALKIYQDVQLFTSLLDKGKKLEHSLKKGRFAWMQVASGSIQVNQSLLKAGDGGAVSKEERLTITANDPSEILLFDLN